MSQGRVFAIEELVDGQRIRAFNYNLLFWSFIALLIDGYDIASMAFSAPALIRAWHVPKPALAPVFSASLLGILIGAPLLGWVGDRLGRRSAIIIGCVICGVFSLLSAHAGSVGELRWLRLCTGIGLGGILPNAISLNAEMAPKRLRATMVIVMFTGITVGGAVPGAVSAWLVPEYGWQVLFLIGGIAPLVIAACLIFTLPESIKFLALRPDRAEATARLVRRMRPDVGFPADASFVVSHTQSAASARDGSIGRLFSNGLGGITVLLWLLFVLNLMTSYLLTSWMPILFESNGLASSANAVYQIGGTVGAILVSVLLDRFGFAVVAGLFLLAVPAVAAIGLPGLPTGLLLAIVSAAGFCVLGLQFGLNASAGLIYPTAARSKGVGMAFAIGRFGSIFGPFLGAGLISANIGLERLFQCAAIPLAIGLVVALVMTRLCTRRFGGAKLEDSVVAEIAG
jgi:AAHS family 4-hydroxybenzoate transporter-like MFS transporter